MQSRLGASIGGTRRQWLLLIIGLVAVTVDMTCFVSATTAHSPWRLAMGLGVLMAYLVICSGRRCEIGLVVAPEPSLRFWGITVAVLAALSLLVVGAAGAWLWWRNDPWPASSFQSATDMWWFLRAGVMQAPLSEELVYRLALCVPLVVLLGPRPAILISAAAFALVHQLYGNFAPNHVAAGFILSWAYVRSNCLWLPIALHALGNLLVFLLNVLLMGLGT